MSFMFTRQTEQEKPAESPEVEIRQSRLAKFAKFATKKAMGAAEYIRDTSVDTYYRGAYHAGQATEYARGMLGKAVHGNQAYIKGVDYGQRYNESADSYTSRMKYRGRYTHVAVAVAGLAAVLVASRLGAFDGGIDGSFILDAGETPTPTSSPPTEVAEVPMWDFVDDSFVAEPKEAPIVPMSLSEVVSSTELSEQARAAVDTALDGHKVTEGESVWSIIKNTLIEDGVPKPSDEQINLLKNDFLQRHGSQVDANGWLHEGQILTTK